MTTDTCKCSTCGHAWQRGENGSHDCSKLLSHSLAIAKAQLEKSEGLYFLLAKKYHLLRIEHEALVHRHYPSRVIDDTAPL